MFEKERLRTHGQFQCKEYTVDIEKMLKQWQVAIFKNLGKDNETLIKCVDEIKSKTKAIKIANQYCKEIENYK